MRLTFAELQAKTRQLLRDEGTAAPEWSVTQVQVAVNWAVTEVAKRLGLTQVNAYLGSISPASGKLKFAIPTDCIKVRRVSVKPAGGSYMLLRKSSLGFEDAKDPNWRSKTGTAARWVEEDGSNIRVIPNPGAAQAVNIGYIQRPTTMSAPGDYPDARIPEAYHEALKYGAAYYLVKIAATAEDMAIADNHLQTFRAMIGEGPLTLAVTEVDR